MTLTDPAPDPAAALALLRLLADRGYRFVTPTPTTHRRVVARPDRARARSVSDVLGWSLPFAREAIDDAVVDALAAAGLLVEQDGLWRSRVRVSSLHDRLFLHSAYPTEAEDAVFFGPDSYRFADLIAAELGHAGSGGSPPRRIVDIGTGSGVGAIVAAGLCRHAEVVMTDINPTALAFARINATFAGVAAEPWLGRGLAGGGGEFDLVTANPPYIIDEGGPTYRAGGDMHGGRISLDMAAVGVGRLAPGGRLILYTGSAILDGRDPLRDALADLAATAGCTLRYREIDPDVFGEELDNAAYRDVDRIALVAAIVTRPR